MIAREIEDAVFELDQIRIVIRCRSNTVLDDYSYQNRASATTSVTDWLDQRILPIVGGHQVVVIDGSGVSPHGRMQIKKLRESYATE